MKKKVFLSVFLTALFLSSAVIAQIIYEEDFSTDPNFTSMSPEHAYWDEEAENYFVNTFDDWEHLYWGYSPQFPVVNTSQNDVIIQFDMLCENANWGTYPGVHFYLNEPLDISEESRALSVMFIWSDGNFKKIRISDNSGNRYTSANSYSDNVWYRVTINYSASTNKADLLITDLSTDDVFYQVANVDFELSDFAFLGVGFNSVPNYGNQWSPIRLDNVEISGTSSDPGDGMYIYYLSDETGNRNLWRAQYSPSGLINAHQLTHYTSHNIRNYDICEATQSVAYILAEEGDHRGYIYLADINLQNSQIIPNQPSAKAGDAISFSPDGNTIAFGLGAPASTSNNLVVATINVDGSGYNEIIGTHEPRGVATHKQYLHWTDIGLFIGDTRQWSAFSTQFEIFHYDFETFTNLTNTTGIGERNPFLSPDGSKIVYETSQTGNPNRYGLGYMNADGTNQTTIVPLTSGVGYSPGGWLNDNTIIYQSSIDGTSDIWQMNIDGSEQVKLSFISGSSQSRPRVFYGEVDEPDPIDSDSYIYYLSDETGNTNLWRAEYNPDGLINAHQLTHYTSHHISNYDICEATQSVAYILREDGDHRGYIYLADINLQNSQIIPNQPSEKAGGAIAFSPDGNTIAFGLGATQSTSNNLMVATIDIDGSNYQQIISANEPRGHASHKQDLDWTEIGLFIGDTRQWSAFSTQFEIYHYDFTDFTNLTNTSSIGERRPFLSPNNQKIVYGTSQTGSPNSYGIGVMDVDGSNQTTLIPLTSGVGYRPGGWIDDNTILYQSSIDGTSDIWQMSSDGSDQVKLSFISGSSQSRPRVFYGEVDEPDILLLCEALDNCELEFTTGGHAEWFGQTVVSHDGVDAAQSGNITHNQESWFETTVEGPGELSFYWKVSSENNFDYLNFYINGTRMDRISGNVDWHIKEYSIDGGTHTLKWSYTKDGSVSHGQDCGWVDQLVYIEENGDCTPGWTPVPNLENNMQVVAQIMLDDNISLNPNDVLGAFVGDECRGVASPMPDAEGRVFLTVGSNVTSGEMVELRIWNSELCESCDAGPGFEFVSQGEVGTYNEPHMVTCGVDVDLTLNYGQGFTWFSVNVDPGDMHLNPLFADLDPCADDRIIGQTQFALWTGTEWVGGLTEIDHTLMYRMRLCSNQSITITGAPAPLDPISLNPGFTWLGYLPQECQPVNYALESLTPVYDDRIIGQNAFALFNGTEWVGSLLEMCPGEGYIIKLANPDILNYSMYGKGKMDAKKGETNTSYSPAGVYPDTHFQHTMMLLAKLDLGQGKLSLNPDDVVYAFVDGECRGMASPMPEHEGTIFMNIGSDSDIPQEVIFKVWLDEMGQLVDINERISFQPLGAVGTIDDALILTMDGTVDISDLDTDAWHIGEPYPNPFSGYTTVSYSIAGAAKITIRVFNTTGQLIAAKEINKESAGNYAETVERGQLSPGMYFISVDINAEERSLQRTDRLIVK